MPVRGHLGAWAGLVAIWAITASLTWMLVVADKDVAGEGLLAVRIAAGVFLALAGPFALIATWGLLTAGNRTPQWRVDEEGIALWTFRAHAEIPWRDVVGVGVGFKRPPALSSTVRLPQGHAVEVFVASDPAVSFPEALALVVDEDPPYDGLPRTRLRLLGAGDDMTDSLGAQVSHVHPEKWIGTYQRRWKRNPGA